MTPKWRNSWGDMTLRIRWDVRGDIYATLTWLRDIFSVLTASDWRNFQEMCYLYLYYEDMTPPDHCWVIIVVPYHPRQVTKTYSYPPSAAYMRQWIRSALVQTMACRLFGAKPFFLTNAGLLSTRPLGTNFSEILIKIQNFSFTKMHLQISSA